jgi:hypothetical protein
VKQPPGPMWCEQPKSRLGKGLASFCSRIHQ